MDEHQELQFPIVERFDNKTNTNIKRSAFLEKLAYRGGAITRLLDNLGNRLKVPQQLANNYKRGEFYLPQANQMPDDLNTVGYVGDMEITAFLNYRNQLKDEARLSNSESRTLYEKQIDILSETFNSNPSINTLINFGVCYAYIDSILARRFPEIQFQGVDRSPCTKALNEAEFHDLANMHYFTEDIYDHLANHDYTNGLFFHSRTAVILNKPILENIYNAAFNSGCELIVGFEQFGVCRQTYSPIEFTLEDKDSTHFRGFMFMHNYPGILLKAGYRTERFMIFKTGHPFPDFRMAAFVARRSPSLRNNH